MKLSTLLAGETCLRKAFLNDLNLKSTKGKNYYISSAVSELLSKVKDFSRFSISNFIEELEEKLPNDKFYNLTAKKEEIKVIEEIVERYAKWEKEKNRKKVLENPSGYISVGKEFINVSAHVIIENEDNLEIIKYRTSEPKLSYRGQKEETLPQNNIELYLLYKLGLEIAKDFKVKKPVVASFYHLKSKDDKASKLEEEFEVKKGKNIIQMSFSPEDSKYVEDKILKIIDSKMDLDSEMCDSKKCSNCNFINLCSLKKTASKVQNVEYTEPLKKVDTLNLTKSQLAAVNFNEGIVRINAGAGSGKTTIVALRVCELIQNGTNPRDILLITFTNKGAQEMKEKIAFWIDKLGIKNVRVDKMHIMTFNSWGEMVIKKKFNLLGYSAPPSLLEKVEKYDILLDIIDKNQDVILNGCNYINPLLDFPNAKGIVVTLDAYIDIIKSKYTLTYEEYCEVSKIGFKLSLEEFNHIMNIYNEFNHQLKSNNKMQYQDQINNLIELIDEHYDEMESFSYKHIIVDEFQDTNQIQLDVISFLTTLNKFKSLMVVGDDSQSIFSFRHATPEFIINFHNYFQGVEDIFLVDNFRSTPEIIKLANHVNALNLSRIDKNLISRRESIGLVPNLVGFRTKDSEYHNISAEIKRKISSGTNPMDIAVIARTKTELFNMESHFKEFGIPYVLDIAEPILNNDRIHILSKFAEVFVNEDVTLPIIDFLAVTKFDKIKEMSSLELETYIKECREVISSKLASFENEDEKIEYFFKVIETITDDDLMAFIQELKAMKFSLLSNLIDYLKKFVLYEDDKTVEKDENKYNAVVLTTAHSSKGKEWDVVYNILDKFSYSANDETREEERRLLFVCITRAKKELILTYHMNMDSKKNYKNHNQFIDELINSNKVLIDETDTVA